jgi:hypothetical protein
MGAHASEPFLHHTAADHYKIGVMLLSGSANGLGHIATFQYRVPICAGFALQFGEIFARRFEQESAESLSLNVNRRARLRRGDGV